MTTVSRKEPLTLKFDHNVIEHLGLKLYQNKPTNVIAELVSNGWDADACNIWIDVHTDTENSDDNFISVVDDGGGMSREVIQKRFLIIGLPKRSAEHPEERTLKGRTPMGRKGIGKLAPFGIARELDIISVAKDDAGGCLLNWFRLELSGILSVNDKREYNPIEIVSNTPINETELYKHDRNDCIRNFLNRINKKTGTGTLLILRSLSLRKLLTPKKIIEAMGRRFTVTLLRDDFNVYVNDSLVTEKEALPEFQHRIPASGFGIDNIDGKEVKYWAGFVQTADWPQDEAGVGVYTHGKIAQDRPFTFGQKGREIIARYMYAVVEADWLDDLPDDVVSTRSNIRKLGALRDGSSL
jgi:hypothetical protein